MPQEDRAGFKILDVACGTGLVGVHLASLGFKIIDGVGEKVVDAVAVAADFDVTPAAAAFNETVIFHVAAVSITTAVVDAAAASEANSVPATADTVVVTHGHHFFRRGGEDFFFMCTWVKNGYRGGAVFGCHSLGEEGGKGGEENF